MIETSAFKLRSLDVNDHSALAEFLRADIKLHRHLDWRLPIEWLGRQPFWAMERSGKIQAALAILDDPPGIHWVRLFAVDPALNVGHAWDELFEKVYEEISSIKAPAPAALAYQDWFRRLLVEKGWEEFQQVIMMKWHKQRLEAIELENDYSLRNMTKTDVNEVSRVDQLAFEPHWQQSQDAAQLAYQQSSYATVVEYKGQVIGYQTSTAASLNVHLARLAVLPQYRRKGIASAMVTDMLLHFRKPWIREITLNTQNDNQPSLKLYEKLGFERTGEDYPILIYKSNK